MYDLIQDNQRATFTTIKAVVLPVMSKMAEEEQQWHFPMIWRLM